MSQRPAQNTSQAVSRTSEPMGHPKGTAWQPRGTLVADGKTLEYCCQGPPPSDQPTLVLLHEGLGCNLLWRDFPSALSQATGLGVFRYSRAGYGQSDPVSLPRPLDYMTLEATHVLPTVLATLGVQRVILVGHSDGATIAAIYAGLVADSRLAGIVLMAPHFFTEALGLAEIAEARKAFDSGRLRERLQKYHRDPDNAFRGWSDSWLDPGFVSWNVADVLENINCPVLTIQGKDDPYGTLAQIEAVTDRVTQAAVSTLIIDDCKHAPHLEQGRLVVAAISEFCKPLTASAFPVQLPTHAYLPGQNTRHAEATFEALRQTAQPGHTADQLAHCQAFQAGLHFLNAGFYWEAHEVLEPVWMILPEGSVERRFVQGLIQLANGCLKLRMGRLNAARRLVAHARELLLNAGAPLIVMTLETREVHAKIDLLEQQIILAQ